jgi:hypothetical protein
VEAGREAAGFEVEGLEDDGLLLGMYDEVEAPLDSLLSKNSWM